jgi:hypothetical protein
VARSAAAAILITASDDPLAWVPAGQALQRVLLLVGSSGIATALHASGRGSALLVMAECAYGSSRECPGGLAPLEG